MMTVPALLATFLLASSSIWNFETKLNKVQVRPESARTYRMENPDGIRWVQRDAVITFTKKGETQGNSIRGAAVGCENGKGLFFFVDEGGVLRQDASIDEWDQDGGRYIDVLAMLVCSAALDKENAAPAQPKRPPSLPRGGTMI